MLPLLPVYISYFAYEDEENIDKTLINAIGFVIGFSSVFVSLGAFAGMLGGFLQKYQIVVNIITGLVVVFFGLNYIGVFKLSIFRGINNPLAGRRPGFFPAVLFGAVFSVGWTPCVGTFLGTALMLASQQGSALKGIIMLLVYSAGLGIPFIISAILIDKLKVAFGFIKKHYSVINLFCGVLLIIVGILMMTGLIGKYLAFIG
jgi:cytochrome c-type biogenesis protein